MRLIGALIAFVLLASGPAAAQSWKEYTYPQYAFGVSFPAEPKVETKTENFLNKTKDMSISEFTKYMLKECGCGQVQGEDLPYVTASAEGPLHRSSPPWWSPWWSRTGRSSGRTGRA